MKILFKNGNVYLGGKIEKKDFAVIAGKVTFDLLNEKEYDKVVNLDGKHVFPGLVDVHVHLREPGYSYKEEIKTGTLAGAKGGYTAVCSMPNLNPFPDSVENLKVQQDIIDRDAVISVYPYSCITKGEKGETLVDFESMSSCIAFTDDGRGVQNSEMMKTAMIEVKKFGGIIAAHCEDNTLLKGGYIHDGEYAKARGHKGICSKSEWGQVERDLRLAEETGVKYHVCHVSTKESVALIKVAKERGVDVTCETGPHYLILTEKDLQEDGRFKMNPPLREEEDKKALIQGVKDGTIELIATDHAPHSKEEKSKGLEKSMMGVVGLETAFPLLYTYLVKTGEITLEKLIEVMSVNPSKRFNIESGIISGKSANFCVYDLNEKYRISSKDFVSKGKATPFEGFEVYGKNLLTLCNGKVAYGNL